MPSPNFQSNLNPSTKLGMKATDQANPSHLRQHLFVSRVELRVLIVADGNIHFNPDDTDLLGFSLSRLCLILMQSAPSWVDLSLITAHRTDDKLTGANLTEFKFDSTISGEFAINHYHQIWLFGYEREHSELTLTSSELNAIARYMENGGGVFATGDHEDLGFALCGKIPRVGSMRKWLFHTRNPALKAPEKNGPTRIDSLRMGADEVFEKEDQSDSFPQEIRPRFFMNYCKTATHPHPLLRRVGGAVTVLPDHMHEGECIVPKNLAGTYSFLDSQDRPEYPTTSDKDQRKISPVAVAIATSASGLLDLNDTPRILPVEPRCYTIIAAYDGHYVGRGRVVTDSSFHHFTNPNLRGFDTTGKPAADFEVIKKYYANLLSWLSPSEQQLRWSLNLLLMLRYTSPLIEEISFPSNFQWAEILRVGSGAHSLLLESFSASEPILCVLAMIGLIENPRKRAALVELLDPWLPSSFSTEQESEHPNLLFDTEICVKSLLGSGILGIAQQLPENAFIGMRRLREKEDAGQELRTMVAEGVTKGLMVLSETLHSSNERIARFSKGLRSGFASDG